jgi:glycerol dehydrogenase-like iron-containing ADH family enzyme
VIGVGGGALLDSAKVLARRLGVPLVAIPTIRYSAGALRMMRGSTSTRKFASSNISKFSACPASGGHWRHLSQMV